MMRQRVEHGKAAVLSTMVGRFGVEFDKHLAEEPTDEALRKRAQEILSDPLYDEPSVLEAFTSGHRLTETYSPNARRALELMLEEKENLLRTR